MRDSTVFQCATKPRIAALILLPLLLVLCAPHAATDPDTLSRIAMGRLVWSQKSLPPSDPFTFANPSAAFGDSEWLGDLTLFGLQQTFGERGLVALAVVAGTIGYVLSFELGVSLGADAWVMLGLLLFTLPMVGPRIAPRNDVHMLWLVPGFILFAIRSERLRARRVWRAWIPLFVIGWVWANTHSSSIIGAVFLAVALIDSQLPNGIAAAMLVGYAALPWLGLAGSSTYAQLLDHFQHAAIYREMISEWQSPLSSGGVLAVLPLHVLCVAGLANLRAMRASRMRLCMFAVGVLFAYTSRRFLPLTAALIAPAVAVELSRAAWPSTRRFWAVGCALGLSAYLTLGVRSALRRDTPSVFTAPRSAEGAARYIASHLPEGARIANTFDDGPWLEWLTAPRVQHYLDPRNNLGAEVLRHYMKDVLASAPAFEQEVRRFDIRYALMRADDPFSGDLQAYLSTSSDWRVIYWDGHHAIYECQHQHARAQVRRRR